MTTNPCAVQRPRPLDRRCARASPVLLHAVILGRAHRRLVLLSEAGERPVNVARAHPRNNNNTFPGGAPNRETNDRGRSVRAPSPPFPLPLHDVMHRVALGSSPRGSAAGGAGLSLKRDLPRSGTERLWTGNWDGRRGTTRRALVHSELPRLTHQHLLEHPYIETNSLETTHSHLAHPDSTHV